MKTSINCWIQWKNEHDLYPSSKIFWAIKKLTITKKLLLKWFRLFMQWKLTSRSKYTFFTIIWIFFHKIWINSVMNMVNVFTKTLRSLENVSKEKTSDSCLNTVGLLFVIHNRNHTNGKSNDQDSYSESSCRKRFKFNKCILKFKSSAFQFSFKIGTNFPDTQPNNNYNCIIIILQKFKNIWKKEFLSCFFYIRTYRIILHARTSIFKKTFR